MITYYCIRRHRRRRQERAEQQNSQSRQNEYSSLDVKGHHYSDSSVSLMSDASVSVTYELPGDPARYELSNDNISQVSVSISLPETESDLQSLPELHELHSETSRSLIPQDMRQISRIPSPSDYSLESYSTTSLTTVGGQAQAQAQAQVQTPTPALAQARSKVITARVIITPPTPIHDDSNESSPHQSPTRSEARPVIPKPHVEPSSKKLRRSAGRQFKVTTATTSTERSRSVSPEAEAEPASIVVGRSNNNNNNNNKQEGAEYKEFTAAISLTEKLEKASVEKDRIKQLKQLVEFEKQLKMVILEELRSSGQI